MVGLVEVLVVVDVVDDVVLEEAVVRPTNWGAGGGMRAPAFALPPDPALPPLVPPTVALTVDTSWLPGKNTT